MLIITFGFLGFFSGPPSALAKFGTKHIPSVRNDNNAKILNHFISDLRNCKAHRVFARWHLPYTTPPLPRTTSIPTVLTCRIRQPFPSASDSLRIRRVPYFLSYPFRTAHTAAPARVLTRSFAKILRR